MSLCLFRTGGPAEVLESESDDTWLAVDGKTTEMGRLRAVCEPDCFPDMRRTLWAPPAPAATTTMLMYPVVLLSELRNYRVSVLKSVETFRFPC